jgi:hypothetical protein
MPPHGCQRPQSNREEKTKMNKQMTPAQIELIQQSFARLAPISDKAAALFYDRLFETAPEVKPLFRGDMTKQGRKLMATLALVVNGLNKLDAILPAASVLAKRHVGYGGKGGALRNRRRGAALDARKGSRPFVDARTGGGMGPRLRDLVRLHGPGGVWPRPRGQVRTGRRLT